MRERERKRERERVREREVRTKQVCARKYVDVRNANEIDISTITTKGRSSLLVAVAVAVTFVVKKIVIETSFQLDIECGFKFKKQKVRLRIFKVHLALKNQIK